MSNDYSILISSDGSWDIVERISSARAYSKVTSGHIISWTTGGWVDITPGGTVDQTYDSASANAQSGIAVAQAIASKGPMHTSYIRQFLGVNPVTINSANTLALFGFDSVPAGMGILIHGIAIPDMDGSGLGEPVPFYYCVWHLSGSWMRANISNLLAPDYITITDNLTENNFSINIARKSIQEAPDLNDVQFICVAELVRGLVM